MWDVLIAVVDYPREMMTALSPASNDRVKATVVCDQDSPQRRGARQQQFIDEALLSVLLGGEDINTVLS